jgi:uncharacterized phiE125 gp8 family phage protein
MLQKIVDAVAEPVSLEEAKAHLRVNGAIDDAYIGALITAARTDAENRLQRSLTETTWRVTLDYFPEEIMLPMPQALEVITVQYIDDAGNLQTADPLTYSLDSVREPAWIVPNYGEDWPATRDQINAVRVTYKAGYLLGGTNEQQRAAVPAPIRQWMFLAIGRMYEFREASLQGQAVHDLQFADGLLDTYRVFTI